MRQTLLAFDVAVKPARKARWTSREDAFIRDNYLAMTPREMANALGRPITSVYARKCELGCRHNQLFSKAQESRRCFHCRKKFTVVRSSKRKYCSLKCAYASKDRIVERPKDRGTRDCPRCGKQWSVTTATQARKHCSHACSLKAMAENRYREETRKCINCGTAFTVHSKSTRRCCSPACTHARKSAHGKKLWQNEAYRQKMNDVMSQWHASRKGGTPMYSNRKDGRREDLGGQYFRSAWEANYARYLNFLISQGKVKSWRFEAITFWFHEIKRGVRSYKPDFEVTNNDGTIEFHEVKGWDHPRGKTARQRMAKYYPEVKLILIDQHQYKAIAKWKTLIPGWE